MFRHHCISELQQFVFCCLLLLEVNDIYSLLQFDYALIIVHIGGLC